MNPDQNTNPNPQETQTEVPATVTQPMQSGQQTPPASPQPTNVDAPIPESGDKKSLLKSKRSVIFAIVVGLLVLSAGAALAFFYLPKLAYNKQVKDCVSKGGTVGESYPPTCITPIPEESADPTADWEIYSFPEYGYSFALPTGYEISQNKTAPSEPYILQSMNLHEANMEEVYIATVQSLDLESAIEKLKSNSGYSIDGTTTINNREWTMASGQEQGVQYLIQIGSKTYTLNGSDSDLMQQILFTFKFIESVDATSWEIYKNDLLNIEFKYPPNLSIEYKTQIKEFSDELLLKTADMTYMSIEIPSCVTGGFYKEQFTLDKNVFILNSSAPRYKSSIPSKYGEGYTTYVVPHITSLEANICMFINIDVRNQNDTSDLDLFDQILSTFKFTN